MQRASFFLSPSNPIEPLNEDVLERIEQVKYRFNLLGVKSSTEAKKLKDSAAKTIKRIEKEIPAQEEELKEYRGQGNNHKVRVLRRKLKRKRKNILVLEKFIKYTARLIRKLDEKSN